ncbi:MAG: multicopper oxidase domain-containing protein [Acidobacteriia bacterium]|nr:multicopper oxidase domain-containing protein [Terriglobia bacterium]
MAQRCVLSLVLCFACLVALTPPQAQAQAVCSRTLTANVVALDQPFFLNRLGALESTGMMFALQRDVIPISGTTIGAGNVQLRSDKRPRPMVLRMNVGDCLTINFTNLLAPTRKDNDQVLTRNASIHVIGMQLNGSIASDGSFVGANASSFAVPGQTVVYKLFAQHEGGYVMYSTDTVGGEGDGGQQSAGLFGAINVEPAGSRWYRSQVTQNDLQLATTGTQPDGVHPKVNYEAVYPVGHPQAGQPILNMLLNNEIVKTDLTALITGPLTTASTPGRFPAGTFFKNPELPDREQPFREFTIIYHDEIGAVQAFPYFFNPDPVVNKPPANVGAIDPGLIFTLHSVVDGFAINYGTGGIGSEIIANRLGVGPMWNCTECNYEENFLSAWAVGDPAMVVDIPANVRDAAGNLIKGPKATKALYPDDPSNVYHSYISDHTKFRILHAGVKEHHIHHQHAHQWVHTPNSDNSSYDDSQAIGPGAAFTLEMTYNGSGNRNQTIGDSIFHCHFYPHFAQGMWSLWRVHDVFEPGTKLDANGRPAPGSRAYPDGEIATGTPIPALVPIPTIAMAPMPGPVSIVAGQVVLPNPVTVHPGYPFFVAAVAGHRPPKPPYFTEFDGGLPRHVITGGTFTEAHTRLDFSKHLLTAQAKSFPELGTQPEVAAINYLGVRNHPSYTPEGVAASFVTNGLPRKTIANPSGAQMGAPFADPCIDDNGKKVGTDRLYKSADIQLDVKYNKVGWHYPQHRMAVLWEDVAPTFAGTRPPQPLFFRANTDDCITFKFTNLVPKEYTQDDFQVQTPTDVIGQHIHLVKFDVMVSDGAGNGWNYEEGGFSPEEVRGRIAVIDAPGGSWNGAPGTLVAKQHPFFAGTLGLGAQTVVERWYADPTLNNAPASQDRTLRTVFTHDHFGPSTHQQAGLYAGLLIEPQGSTWKDSESGVAFSGRADGGPTGWEAIITDTLHPDLSYREFMMEFQDYTLAYWGKTPVNPPARDEVPLDPTVANGTVLLQPATQCPVPNNVSVVLPPPCPEAISAADVGTFTVNYRNEPIPLRIRDPLTNTQAAGAAGDLAQVYRSTVTRADSALNVQPAFYPPLTADLRGGDPYTPVFRTYQDDKIQVRMLVGAHEEGHNFHVHGTRWLREPSDARSGWRGSQMMGISEHFEFDLPPLSNLVKVNGVADFLYEPGASEDDQWNGLWGLIRAYNGLRTDLTVVPNNTNGGKQNAAVNVEDFNTSTLTSNTLAVSSLTTTSLDTGTTTTSTTGTVPTGEALDETDPSYVPPSTCTTLCVAAATTTTTDLTSTATISDTGTAVTYGSTAAAGSAYSVCPKNAPIRIFDVTAIPASALPGGKLVYNSRTTSVKMPGGAPAEAGPLNDPTAILYVRTVDLDPTTHNLKAGIPVEPLILRAAAGDCINLTLRNHLPNVVADLPGYNTLPMIVNNFNSNQVAPSHNVGLHPEMLSLNVLNSSGVNVGLNPAQTVSPAHKRSYQWYAGVAWVNPSTNAIVHTPVEFGSVALMPAEPIKQASKGAIGALIIEPQGSTWLSDANSRASANVTKADSSVFREFVLLIQNDVNMRYASGHPVNILARDEDPEETGQAGFNYRSEPHWFRKGYAPESPLTPKDGACDPICTKDIDFTNVLSNTFTNVFTGVATTAEPQTPIFNATVGQAIRLRLVQPVGHPRNNIFQLHGHVWEEEPYTTPVAFTGATYSGRTVIGTSVLGSTIIADQPLSSSDFVNNRFSEWEGAQMGVGPSSHFDIVPVNGAGGNFKVTGDYLYRTHQSFQFDKGVWGILRVKPVPQVLPTPDPVLLVQ